MCFSYDNSSFPTDPPEASETTPTPSAPNTGERTATLELDSPPFHRPTTRREYHQPDHTLRRDSTPFNPPLVSPSPNNIIPHPTTMGPNRIPSPGQFSPHTTNGSPTNPAFSRTSPLTPTPSSLAIFTDTFSHFNGYPNMHRDVRTFAGSNQWNFERQQHPPEASPNVGSSTHPSHPTGFGQSSERHGQFSPQPAFTQDAGLSTSSPGIHPSGTPSLRRQTSSSPNSPRRLRRDKNKEPCRRCKRSHLRCEICPNTPDLCINCKKHGRERCPTPEPQPSTRGSRRRTRQRNQTDIPSSSPALGHTENPDNDVDANSTSGGLYSPLPYPPPFFTATHFEFSMETQIPLQGSANRMAQYPIFGNAASTSRHSTYSNEIPLGDSHPLVSPSAWSLLAPPASGVQRLDERFGRDGRDNSIERTTSPEPASPHSQTSHSQPGSPSHSIFRHTPGS